MAKHTEKIRLNVTSHSVRASQAVLQYGVGAMVEFPIVKDTTPNITNPRLYDTA